jgi:hypothetical protein
LVQHTLKIEFYVYPLIISSHQSNKWHQLQQILICSSLCHPWCSSFMFILIVETWPTNSCFFKLIHCCNVTNWFCQTCACVVTFPTRILICSSFNSFSMHNIIAFLTCLEVCFVWYDVSHSTLHFVPLFSSLNNLVWIQCVTCLM